MAHAPRKWLVGIAATIVVALMSVPTLSGRGSGAGDLSAPNVVKQTNDVRMKNGLGRLTLDPLLTRAAQAKAEDMAARGYFAHRTPDGRTPWDWIRRAGYEFQAAAENLAVGYPTDADLVSAWMESEDHRQNLLNQKYTDIGIGIARGKYKGQDSVFVVQMFGTPRTAVVSTARPATAIPDGPPLAPAPLTADNLVFDVSTVPGLPLEASVIPFDPAPLPAVALEAAAVPPGPMCDPVGLGTSV